ncbi:YcaO-like family protein [Undibacterium terreum]|nr:YcaO-like family protein [Undibacterium terreum]
MNSSLRVRPIAESLKYAKELAVLRGITRVTDTTPLDRIGIPVFASIRPGAVEGSLCVNAGKGLLPEEAQIGAYMESIEFSFAEEGGAHVGFQQSTIAEMLASYDGQLELSDFSPLMGKTAGPSDKIKVTPAELVGTGKAVLVPSELVFLPFLSADAEPLFGRGTSCGLASGNSVEEASVHALAELIEHDIASFEFIHDTSSLIDTTQLTGAARALVEKIEQADFHVYLRHVENCFGMPYFHAVIAENSEFAAVNICGGYGVHPVKEIAAIRALAEAAQSRLSTIHGGRDDLSKYPKLWGELGRAAELAAIAEYRAELADNSREVDFESIADWSGSELSLDAAWTAMVDALNKNGIHQIIRVVFTEPQHKLQVVKLIVPKMEDCHSGSMRFGPRLRAYVNSF